MMFLNQKIQMRIFDPNTLVFLSCFVFIGLFNMMTYSPINEAYQTTPKECNINGGMPIAHDNDPIFEAKLNGVMKTYKHTFDSYEMPEIAVVEPSFYFTATDPRTTIKMSYPSLSRAWNETFAITDHESITLHKSDIWGSEGFNDEYIKEAMMNRESIRELPDGKYTAFSGWYVGNFGHFVHDFASKIAWLKSLVKEDTKFLLPHHPMYQNILNEIDEDFVRNRVQWILYGESVHVKRGSLTIMLPKSNDPFVGGFPQTASIFTEHFRRWLEKSNWSKDSLRDEPKKKVIFYTRKSSTPRRNVEHELENALIHKIVKAMEKRGQTQEDLIIFSGKDQDGNTLPMDAQRHLFAMADTAIGPHGSGLTNVIWMDPRCGPASTRPKVLEFASSDRTPLIQTGSFWGYWFLFGALPWIDYHYIYYTRESNEAITYVDIDVFERTLHQMWNIK